MTKFSFTGYELARIIIDTLEHTKRLPSYKKIKADLVWSIAEDPDDNMLILTISEIES